MSKEFERSSSRLNFFIDEEFDFQLLRGLGAEYYGGASLGECLSTAKRIKDGDLKSWVDEWANTAAFLEKHAENYLSKEQKVSAREAFLRASMYYRAAEYYGFFSNPERQEHWEKSRRCFQQAGALLDISFEILEIPFEDMKLPGYFLKPADDNIERPTLMVMTGFDGTAEELYFGMGAGTVMRGYNVLLFEGPGQTGMNHLYPDIPFRPDYEAPISAVVDYALSRNDVDVEKLAILGISLGGYFAPCAAIHDKRIKACIANSPIIDMYQYFGDIFQEALEIDPKYYKYTFSEYPMLQWLVETFGRRFGADNVHDFMENMKNFNIVDSVSEITCPTLTMIGEGEGKEAQNQARKFYNAVNGPKNIKKFTEKEGAEAHCQVGNPNLACAVVIDWLEKVLWK